jgi:hypothetical protein
MACLLALVSEVLAVVLRISTDRGARIALSGCALQPRYSWSHEISCLLIKTGRHIR